MEAQVESPRAKNRHLFRAHFGMVLVQLGYSGYQIVAKVALNDGTNKLVFNVYRNLVALLILAPLAYFTERGIRPPLDLPVLLMLFFLGVGLFGNQVLFLAGLAFTNPTYAAALQPTIPVFTFILSLLMGLEKLNLGRIEGQARLGGIIVSVSGAMLMAMLRGPAVFGHDAADIGRIITGDDEAKLVSNVFHLSINTWILGVLCLIGNCICSAASLAVQAKLFAKYPATISVTAYSHFFGLLLIAAAALLMDNISTDWNVNRAGAIGVLYAGIVASSACYGIMSWSNKILGPSLVALYNPLQPISSAILSLIFLNTPVYLGSIFGGVLVAAGLYLVTWASFITEQGRPTMPLLSEPLIRQGAD